MRCVISQKSADLIFSVLICLYFSPCLTRSAVLPSTFQLYIHVTVHRTVIDFFLTNQPGALIIPILFCYKTLHVSGIFSVHHREFSTVHSALVSFVQVFDDRIQAESGWNCVPS